MVGDADRSKDCSGTVCHLVVSTLPTRLSNSSARCSVVSFSSWINLGTDRYLFSHGDRPVFIFPWGQTGIYFPMGTDRYLFSHGDRPVFIFPWGQTGVYFPMGTDRYLFSHGDRPVSIFPWGQSSIYFPMGTDQYLLDQHVSHTMFDVPVSTLNNSM